MHKILTVSLTAALLSVRLSGMAEAAYTERDVNRMEDLISSGNWVDLRIFLLANPRIMNGSDAFTVALRKFLEETDSLYTALTFDSSIFPDTSIAIPTAPPPKPIVVARPTPPQPPQVNGPAVSQSSQQPGRSARAVSSLY